MGPELENTPNMGSETSAKKENGTDAKKVGANYLNCAINYEDYTSLVEQVEGVHGSEDVQVDIGSEDVQVDIEECTNPADTVLLESDREDTTESSSSFESIVSGAENCTSMADARYTSEYDGDATSELALRGFGDIFRMRKKKLSSEWREFVQPLVWRCKWVELKILKLQSQALELEKQLQEYDHQKQLQLDGVQVESLGSKSLPYSCKYIRDKVLKRKKRRRIEDTLDIAAYMSNHNLFSYYEKRKSVADGSFLDKDVGKIAICSEKINDDDEFGIQDELHLEPTDGHVSLEKMLRKIEILQSQVRQHKTRIDKVMSENVGIFLSTDDMNLLLPCNALGSSARNSASLLEDRVRLPVRSSDVVSQLISEYNMALPGSAAPSCGLAMNNHDAIETNPEDDILIYDQRMNGEPSNLEEAKIKSEEKPQVVEQVQEGTVPPALPDDDVAEDDQPAPRTRSISRLTAPNRRRGRRKARGRRNY